MKPGSGAGADSPEARRYNRIRRWLGVADFVLGLALMVVLLTTGWSGALRDLAYETTFQHYSLALFLYVLMAAYAGIGWAFNARLASMMATAISTTGAIFTFIALVTGSLWGRPAWGVWWVWDARLTSTLILMFLYIGFISLQSSIDDPRRADRAGAVLALVGVINVPIIYFSVQWWNSLHQGATIRIANKPTMAPSMLAAMLILLAACWMYSIAVVLVRVRYIIRERESPWLAEVLA